MLFGVFVDCAIQHSWILHSFLTCVSVRGDKWDYSKHILLNDRMSTAVIMKTQLKLYQMQLDMYIQTKTFNLS